MLVDLRGTGGSAPLGCKAFSRPTRRYVARAGRCAAQIGPKRDLFSTSQAVQDIEVVLRALHAGKIDLYGDSYGTYAAQAYALRFPQRLRSLTLDAAYPLPGTDPAWADLVEAIRIGLELSCSRSVTCPVQDPVKLVTRFADRVREEPILGFGRDGDGTRTRVRLDEDAFVQLVSAGYWYPGLWRDLPAAILAANRGDTAAILRLAAETVTVVGRAGGSSDLVRGALPLGHLPRLPAALGLRHADGRPARRGRERGSPPTRPARSRPSAPRPGPAPTTRASSPASAGRRRRGRIRPTRPEPPTRTSRRSS